MKTFECKFCKELSNKYPDKHKRIISSRRDIREHIKMQHVVRGKQKNPNWTGTNSERKFLPSDITFNTIEYKK